MTTLFIGVVSHQGSRFSVSQGPLGLAGQLQERLGGLDVQSMVRVNTDDLLNWEAGTVTDQMTQASLTAQLHLERQWARFLHRPTPPTWWFRHGLRWARRGQQALRSPGPRVVERLLNIELSHLDLMGRALAAGTDWALILEDDAACPALDDCADGLAGIMHESSGPAYVNVSQSFDMAALGIDHLLRAVPGAQWRGTSRRSILCSARPVTNTVCAILYRADFLRELVPAMNRLPMQPVVPIDWKLNLALMDLFSTGVLKPGDCWLVDPAPIDQMSMRALA